MKDNIAKVPFLHRPIAALEKCEAISIRGLQSCVCGARNSTAVQCGIVNYTALHYTALFCTVCGGVNYTTVIKAG
jgi:hypothetical protein